MRQAGVVRRYKFRSFPVGFRWALRPNFGRALVCPVPFVKGYRRPEALFFPIFRKPDPATL